MNTTPEDNTPTLREHVYDGIQEYDQKLPNWWLFSWYITMVWFVVWWLSYYQLGIGRTDEEEMALAAAFIKQEQDKALEGIGDEQLWKMSRDPVMAAAGRTTYETTCAACHGADLTAMQGGIKLAGLPLNDKEWKHGGTPTQVLQIVRKGAPDITKGMPAWEPVLGTRRVVETVAYILSHHQESQPVTLSADSPLREGAEGAGAAKP